MIEQKMNVPLWYKYALTVEEAKEYFGIGEKKLRWILSEHSDADFVLHNGTKNLIKRRKFEEFLDATNAI